MTHRQVRPPLPIVASVLLVCVVAAVPRAFADAARRRTYALTAWVAEKGLPPGDVFAIAQDADGYLWLGTPTGLFRFDGVEFTPWRGVDPSAVLPAGPVHALVAAPDGGLWVGFGGGGGVVRLNRGAMTRYTPADGAPGGVTAMAQDRQGTLWAATRRGLYQFADGRWVHLGHEAGLDGGEALSIHEDRSGRLWVGTGRGVYRQTDDTFQLVDASATSAQSLTSDKSGAVWVTDANRLLARLGSPAAISYARDIRLPAAAWRLMRDSAGQLWAAAFGGGLLRIANPLETPATVEHFEYQHRLAGSPRSLFEDRDGNIWVGMRGGLLRLSPTSFTDVDALAGLASDGVRTTAVGPDGSVWVATGHALNRFSERGHTAYPLSQITALHTDRHGALWVAASRQFGRWVDGHLLPEPLPAEVRASRIMAVATDARDNLWLCTSSLGVVAWDGERITRFDAEVGAPRACQSIHVDRQDRVWVGFLAGGGAVREQGVFRQFGADDGLASGTVLAILEDHSGTIWLSTSNGVSRYQNGRFTSITRANAPVADLVPVLLEDRDGFIWVGINSGAAILRFHPGEVSKIAGTPSHHIEYAVYDETDGMRQGSQTWQSGLGGVRGGDGRLWVATGLGMTIIDPAALPPIHRPVPPHVEEITVDGRRLAPADRVLLPARTSTLRIKYGTISLSSGSKVRFRYMLEGLDDRWMYAESRREVTYSGVPAGAHRFRVETTVDGRWTESGVWEFSIAAPFYRTRAFAGFGVLALVMVGGFASWLRLRAVRQQYALVFAERARVSREIHDTLLQSLAAIGVELETIASQLAPSQDPAREGLRRLRRQVGHCVREARESILELRRNTLLKPRALVDLLQALAADTTASKRVDTTLSVTGRPRQGSDEVDLQLFRIAQEAVSNAIRHGHAGHMRISIAYERDRVVLTVADDGCGFAPEERDTAPALLGEHLGLLTMRERSARVRGRLEIRSCCGRGTTVTATVPLPED